MTIAITSSGISLDGPLVAGEKVAVTVSGLALAAEDKPTLALLARFPDALLASVELAESETAGTWTGELDTATKQTALFFATARADERRDAALELVSGRVSLARLTVPMANSALCPKPDGSPFASPVYVPVPGPPGTGGDPYDQPPKMDGEASAGSADEYARGDHRHPTDTSRMAASATGVDIKAGGDVGNISITAALVGLDEDLGGKQDTISDLATIRSGAAAGATAVQPADLATVATTGNYEDLTNKPTIPSASDFVAKTGDQQMQGDLTVSRAGGAPPSDYVMVGNTMGSNATSFVAVNNDGKQLMMSVGVGNDPAIVTQKGDLFGAALTPANFGTLALQEGIAPAFSSSSTYAVGDYVTYEGLLYKCTTDVSTAGAWNAANWTAVAVTDEMGGGAAYYEIQYLQSTGTQYIDTGVTAGLGVRVVADMEWVSMSNEDCPFGTVKTGSPYTNRFFTVGQIVGSNKYYGLGCAGSWINPQTSAVALTIGTRTSVEVSVSSSVASLSLDGVSAISETGTYSFSEQIPIYLFARNNGSNQPQLNAKIKLYSLKIYSGDTLVRDFVPVRSGFDGGLLDKVSGTFFTNQGTGDFLLGQDVNPPVPTDSPAFTGTPTAPTAAAGTNTTQIATTAFVQTEARYALTAKAPTVSGTSATVACEDRAINDFTVATGIASLTITPPAAVTGRARDFFCRVTLTDSSLPTVTLSGGTIDIGASEVAGMAQGVNLLMFTEIASGHWLASRRSAS